MNHRDAFLATLALASVVLCRAQTGTLGVNAPEINTSNDQPVTFRSKVNLVMVPVVVRDAKGEAVGNLTKADFQLFDKGKKQEITKFTVEKVNAESAAKPAAAAEASGAPIERSEPAPTVPVNFVAYLFDDLHMKFGDMVYVRDAAGRSIDALQPNTRAAIFTVSGQGAVDFTDDRAKLHNALLKLRPRPIIGNSHDCPDVSYYMGDLIVNKNDGQAFQAVVWETMACMHLTPQQMQVAVDLTKSAANVAVESGGHEVQVSLSTLKDVVRRISLMPGQRNIILVSPGFFIFDDQRYEELDVVDRAVRSSVVISALDARGLYTLVPGGDIDQNAYDPNAERLKDQYRHQDAIAASGVLMEMAAGTGGNLIENTNDFDAGFRKLAAPPEYIYMLGFTPDNLKPDGSFHRLKVTVNARERLDLQARHGYFAPQKQESEEAQAKEEIETAVFSRDEMHDLPVELHTQYFKASDTDAKLKVLASVDLGQLAFRKDAGRNVNDLTLVSAVFDNNGNFVSGVRKTLHLRLFDTTMEKLKHAPPFQITSSFDVAPGTYLIRLVVRDAEGHLMAGESGEVQIP